ncbi:MAG TPA: RDD family protein [Planctomycetota bacterium]|nr:RDD family protein [Planctomycetota bacterium]
MPATPVHLAWYITTAPGKPETGPLRTRELKEWAADGRLTPAMLVRRIGMPRPVSAANVQGLFAATPPIDGPSVASAAGAPTGDQSAATETAATARIDPERGERAANPFAPPTARTGRMSRDADATTGSPAGFWSRALATLIDGLILSPVTTVAMLLVFVLPLPVAFFIVLMIQPAYKAGFEAYGGTFGKRALGIRLTGADGSPMTVGRALARNVAHLAAAGLVFIAVLQLFFSAQTVVVDVAGAEPSMSDASAMTLSAAMIATYALGAAQLVSCLVVPFTRRKQALHDLIAGTVCVHPARRRRTATVPVRHQRATPGTAAVRRQAPATARTAQPTVVTTRRFQRRQPLRRAS